MARIQIRPSWKTSFKSEYATKLVGLVVNAEPVDAQNPRPNTNGRAYEVCTDEAAKVLSQAGHKEAAAYFDDLNPYPAMQRIGFLIPTADAEAA